MNESQPETSIRISSTKKSSFTTKLHTNSGIIDKISSSNTVKYGELIYNNINFYLI